MLISVLHVFFLNPSLKGCFHCPFFLKVRLILKKNIYRRTVHPTESLGMLGKQAKLPEKTPRVTSPNWSAKGATAPAAAGFHSSNHEVVVTASITRIVPLRWHCASKQMPYILPHFPYTQVWFQISNISVRQNLKIFLPGSLILNVVLSFPASAVQKGTLKGVEIDIE